MDDEMKRKYTVEIPYGSRSNYLTFINKINKLVGNNNLCVLYVNNVPYALQSFLSFESDKNINSIEDIIKEFGLSNLPQKGIGEFFEEMKFRKWDSIGLPADNEEMINMIFNNAFKYKEKKELESLGYFVDKIIERKKLFVSYCHKNKEIVHKVVDEMEAIGLNVWIDKKCIDYGENISFSIMKGIAESDMGIMFLSKNTLDSPISQFELQNILSAKSQNKKGWFLIKLDDVDVDEIVPGLSNFLYYDYSENSNIRELTYAIKKNFKKRDSN